MNIDSSAGFLILHSMLAGGPFNMLTEPDPANIANDVATFQTTFSPGQYLVPGGFIWLGTNYSLALSLTALIVTLIGVVGWIQVARSFAVSSFVLFVFALGLNTFSFVTLPFRMYNGGEVLLFAAAPWSLYAVRWVVNKPPIVCFAISLLCVTLLFFAKLSGLVVFAANVVAISLSALVSQRRLSSSVITIWVASAIGALCFMMFWLARGWTAASGATFAFSWFPVWYSLAGAAFSGVSGLEFLFWFLGHPWVGIISDLEWETTKSFYYVLGPFGLLLMVWVWFRLRHTRYRNTAVLLLTIILLYAIAIAAMWLRRAPISFEERHFRYAGILFFLLLLTAADQWRLPSAKHLACGVVIVLGFYGLKNSVTGAYAQMRTGYPMSAIYQDIVSPAILEYMRSEIIRYHMQRPIAVVPWPSAARVALSVPQVRILLIFPRLPQVARDEWHGRAENIFVIVPEEMALNGKTEIILRSFTSYTLDNWKQMKLDGMVIYTQ
jgi:hypothetical protein